MLLLRIFKNKLHMRYAADKVLPIYTYSKLLPRAGSPEVRSAGPRDARRVCDGPASVDRTLGTAPAGPFPRPEILDPRPYTPGPRLRTLDPRPSTRGLH
eukprot:1411832-Rhodomonas_salina.1